MARASFRSWMVKNLTQDDLVGIVQHGVDVGWPGLSYYKDTVELYNKYEKDIWDRLYDDAESQGENVMSFIASWRSADQIADEDTFKNAVVWYMAEVTAYDLVGDEI